MLGHNGREQGRGETALEREGRYTGLTQETGRPVIKAIPLNHVLNYVLMYSTNKWDLRGIKTIIIIFIIINIYMFQL